MQQPYFIGVDGGGSTCRVRLCDGAGKILGEALGGPANTRLGLDEVFEQIVALCRQILKQAALGESVLHRSYAGLGLAGLALASERDKVLAYPHPFAGIAAANDAYTACLGAHAGADGAILVLGTGSCGCGIVGDRVINVGGWGFQLGDQGSGACIGRKALRRALLAHEAVIEAGALSRALMTRFCDSPEQAVLWADKARPGDFAALAPLVFEYARQNDSMAATLLRETATDVVNLIKALLARGAPKVALVGGLAEPIGPWLPAAIRPYLVRPAGDALEGAIELAKKHYAGLAQWP